MNNNNNNNNLEEFKKKRYSGYDERLLSDPEKLETRRSITKGTFLNKSGSNDGMEKIKNFTSNYSEDDISILSTFDPIE